MKTAKLTSHLLMCALTVLTFFMLGSPVAVRAQNDPNRLPELEEFIATVTNGDPDVLRGVYVPQVMALAIVQQPDANPRFVSEKNSTATQFSMAAKQGNIGLLAHNTLAGKFFFSIQQNDQIILIYGNGRVETFIVENIFKYQALPRGAYRDLNAQSLLGTGELFDVAYGGEYHLALQTCIEKNGNLDWGRLFIIAKPFDYKDSQIGESDLDDADTEISQPLGVLGWPLITFQSDFNSGRMPELEPIY